MPPGRDLPRDPAAACESLDCRAFLRRPRSPRMAHQQRLEAWLRLSATRLHEQSAALTALDQAIGDGDHGTNMDRGFGAIVAALDGGGWVAEGAAPDSGTALAATLRGAGKTLISTVG